MSRRMSFRPNNQHQRRREQRAQAAVPHPLRTVPPLPKGRTSYLSCCISRSHCHDCSVHCELKIIDYFEIVSYFYVCDQLGFPVEQWEKTLQRQNLPTIFKLIWRRANYNPITQYDNHNRIPTRPPGGSFLYEDYNSTPE